MSPSESLNPTVPTPAPDPPDLPDLPAPSRRAQIGEDFASFVLLLERRIDVDLSLATPESILREDLGFDSLAMAEMLVLFSDDGIELPDELLPELRTLADLHHYFTIARGRTRSAVTP
jgi:acyl carrier protein